MLKEFVEKIVSLAAPTTLKIDERSYSDKQMTPIKDPVDDTAQVSTLTGFVDLLNAGINGHENESCFVHVTSHGEVRLSEYLCDNWGHRQSHLTALLPSEMKVFEYGRYMGQEAFIVGLMSLFVESPDRDALVRQVSSIAGNDVDLSEDDGISQTVTVKRTVALKEMETVKKVVSLAPYRTFREVTQPVSQFVFRVKKTDEGPALAIFEADGGKWRLEAVANIKAWLGQHLSAIKIIA